MTLLEVKKKISQRQIPVLHTHEVAKILNLSNAQASLALHRLEKVGEVVSLKKGLWLIQKESSSFFIGEQLARPYSAYISLQSALYLHGIISQIPEITYVVTLGRAQIRKVLNSTFSYHHIEPEFFIDFTLRDGFQIATPEKALFDFFYFSATQKKIFKSLPEIELPRGFKKKKILNWCKEIKNVRLRSHIERHFNQYCST